MKLTIAHNPQSWSIMLGGDVVETSPGPFARDVAATVFLRALDPIAAILLRRNFALSPTEARAKAGELLDALWVEV